MTPLEIIGILAVWIFGTVATAYIAAFLALVSTPSHWGLAGLVLPVYAFFGTIAASVLGAFIWLAWRAFT